LKLGLFSSLVGGAGDNLAGGVAELSTFGREKVVLGTFCSARRVFGRKLSERFRSTVTAGLREGACVEG